MEFRTVYHSPAGDILITEKDNAVASVHFCESADDSDDTPLLTEAKKQLDEYFHGTRRQFDLPIDPKGTDFQQRVWSALRAIPYGETRTYGQIAAAVGNPKASRAVGMANNKNPIGILIPCHRVIGANGKLVGYAGGLDKKEFLLHMESVFIKNSSEK